MEAANEILNGIATNIRQVTRSMANDSANREACLIKVDSCLSHLDSVQTVIEGGQFLAVENSLRALRSELVSGTDAAEGQDSVERCYSADRPPTGGRGRPQVQLDSEQLVFLRDKGFTGVQMAKQFGCSSSLVYKKLASANLQMRNKYSEITDAELDEHTEELHRNHNNAGNQMMTGYLRASGLVLQRDRVRQSLRRIDPLSSAGRWSRAVTRRTYSVPTPNSLWHLDGHMKLVRWGFVTHGCIDGYSRVITFLQTSTTNEAKVVLNLFVQACIKLGLPSRVRCDHGGENMDVAIFMTLVRGAGRASVITGRSVHNQRIERLWRDVATQVTAYFYDMFYEFEDDGILDISNDNHLYALQLVSLPIINVRMHDFRRAWNSHRLRTEQNRSPEQIWLDGMLQNVNSGHIASTEIFHQPPSLDSRIEDSLQHFNITLQPFMAQQGLQPAQLQNSADATTVASVRDAIVGVTDLKAIYKTAVQILQNASDIV